MRAARYFGSCKETGNFNYSSVIVMANEGTLGMDRGCGHLYSLWEHMETFLLWNIEPLLGFYSVLDSAGETLEKSFTLGEVWSQTDHNGTHWERC